MKNTFLFPKNTPTDALYYSLGIPLPEKICQIKLYITSKKLL